MWVYYIINQRFIFHVFHWWRAYQVRLTKLDCLLRISARGRQCITHWWITKKIKFKVFFSKLIKYFMYFRMKFTVFFRFFWRLVYNKILPTTFYLLKPRESSMFSRPLTSTVSGPQKMFPSVSVNRPLAATSHIALLSAMLEGKFCCVKCQQMPKAQLLLLLFNRIYKTCNGSPSAKADFQEAVAK